MRVDLCEYARRLKAADYTDEQIDMIVAFAEESTVSRLSSEDISPEVRDLERRIMLKTGFMIILGFICIGLV